MVTPTKAVSVFLYPELVNVTLFGRRVSTDGIKLRILRGGAYPVLFS